MEKVFSRKWFVALWLTQLFLMSGTTDIFAYTAIGSQHGIQNDLIMLAAITTAIGIAALMVSWFVGSLAEKSNRKFAELDEKLNQHKDIHQALEKR